jgi:hypothetical protein
MKKNLTFLYELKTNSSGFRDKEFPNLKVIQPREFWL